MQNDFLIPKSFWMANLKQAGGDDADDDFELIKLTWNSKATSVTRWLDY